MKSVVDVKCDITGLGLIPRILFATDGGIGHILEAFAGERVDLTRMTSAAVTDPAERLEVGLVDDERGLWRRSLVRGRQTGRVFVHADSVVFLDRLPLAVADELVETGTNLLKLLTDCRIGTFREIIAEWEGTNPQIAACLGIDPQEVQVARTYQIVVQGQPVARVTESFQKFGFSSAPRS